MSVDLFSAFATDTAAEQQGTLVRLPDCGDTQWRIARAGNKQYGKLLSQLFKKNRATLESKGDAAEEKSEEILVEVYAKTILLGWEGNIVFQGKEYAYNLDMAKKLLAIPDFRAKVTAAAEDLNNFKAVKEEDEKN